MLKIKQLEKMNDVNPFQCKRCKKIFKSTRGTKMHSKKCKSSTQMSTAASQSSYQSEYAENLKKCPHCPDNSEKLFHGNKGLKIHHSRKHKDTPFVEINSDNESTSNDTVSIADVESLLAHFNRNVRVIKRIRLTSQLHTNWQNWWTVPFRTMILSPGGISCALRIERFKSPKENRNHNRWPGW